MMKIITISREFGSGGRELGKRLADELGYGYYDREIEASIAARMDLDADYVVQALEKKLLLDIPLHFGRTLANSYGMKQQVDILVEKQKVLKEIAKAGPCVIVGRAADLILEEYQPFKVFVYADMEYKIKRCQSYGEVGENLSRREMEKEIRKVDSGRAQYRRLFFDSAWDNKSQYHLCINTTGMEIKQMVPALAAYSLCWFAHSGSPGR